METNSYSMQIDRIKYEITSLEEQGILENHKNLLEVYDSMDEDDHDFCNISYKLAQTEKDIAYYDSLQKELAVAEISSFVLK